MWSRLPALLLAVALVAAPVAAHAGPKGPHEVARKTLRHAPDDSYRTDIIFLAHMPPGRAIALWEHVMGASGEARIIPGRADTVVIYDTPQRLERFRALIAALDTAGGDDTHIYLRPVANLAPSALARLIDQILGDERGRGTLVLVSDDRAGQLIVRTTPARYAVLDRLARRLDVPAGERERVVRTLTAPDSDREAP